MLSVNHLVGFGAVARTPTPGGDEYWDSVTTLLHFNGSDASTTFTDETGRSWTTNGNAQIDTAQSKFGGASGLFDGSGDYLSSADSAGFEVGAGNFALEFFLRPNSLAATAEILSKRNDAADANNFWFVRLETSGKIRVYSKVANVVVTDITSSAALTTGAWKHVAVVRNSGSIKIYIEGVNGQVDTTNASTAWADTSHLMIVGAGGSNGSSNYYNGWIDELRITKGAARYTADFTPPAAEFPNYY